LKPDACRRVEGRLNLALSYRLSAFSESQSRSGASSPLSRSKGGVAHLVRSFRLYARMISHDWHVQPSCQRPKRRSAGAGRIQSSTENFCVAFTLLGASAGATGKECLSAHKKESDCPRNLLTIPCGAKSCQRLLPTRFPDDFHIGKGREQESCKRKQIPRFARNDRSHSLNDGTLLRRSFVVAARFGMVFHWAWRFCARTGGRLRN